MTPEKAAVLGVTALIAVLLAIALLSSQPRAGTLPRTGQRTEPRSPRTDPPEDWQRHGDLIEVVRRGGSRTKSRPPKAEPKRKERGEKLQHRGASTGSGATKKGRAVRDGTYVIQDGDTFEGVGIRLYGKKGLGLKIARANPGVDPRRLRGGMVIELPDLDSRRTSPRRNRAAPSRRKAAAPEAGWHVVRSGQVLTGISLEHYGTTRHWRRIFEANRDKLKNPDKVRAGMRLRLPRIPGAATLASR